MSKNLKDLKVEDFVEKSFFSINEEEYVSKALGIMHENNVPGLLVFNNKGHLSGVITEEVLTKSYLDPSTTKVKSLIVSCPKNITIKTNIYEAAYILFNSHLPVVPVFDEDYQNIVGILEIKKLNKEYADKDSEFANKKAIDLATRKVITIKENETVGKALNIMRENKITRLPVLGKKDNLVGIITLHDIIEKLIKPKHRSKRPKEGMVFSKEKIKVVEYPLREVMNDVVYTIDPFTSIKETTNKMYSLKISSLIIIKEKIEGIITDKDILAYIASKYTKPEKFNIIYSFSGDVRNIDKIELEDAISHVRDVLERYEDFLKTGNVNIYIKQHNEKFRSVPLYHIRMRISTSKGMFIGIGETWGLYNAIGDALRKVRDQIEYKKEVEKDPYLGLKKLVKEVADVTSLPHYKEKR